MIGKDNGYNKTTMMEVVCPGTIHRLITSKLKVCMMALLVS